MVLAMKQIPIFGYDATVIIMTIVGAALNTTLVPILSEIDQKRGKEGKLEFLNNILNMIFFLTIILAL